MLRLKPSICVLALVSLVLAGCSSSYKGAAKEPVTPSDGPPLHDLDVSNIPDAVPRVEAIGRAGNKNPYTVLGRTYNLLGTAKGYREVGIASWYGTKFHGNTTSNGEIYSLYGMTAAHKTLPIPSYVRVRNLDNNRSVIVRVNDRGPFHDDRVIDLSYVAAKKLGYEKTGTARVEVTAIDPRDYQTNTVQAPSLENGRATALTPPLAMNAAGSKRADTGATASTEVKPAKAAFLQTGAYTTYQLAVQHRDQVANHTEYPVHIKKTSMHKPNRSVFKVMVGPIVDHLQIARVRERLETLGPFKSFVVYDTGSWES